MFPTVVASVGAFLSGVGSVTAAVLAWRLSNKRQRSEADKRIKEYKEALREGMTLQERDDRKEWEDRWSHLS